MNHRSVRPCSTIIRLPLASVLTIIAFTACQHRDPRIQLLYAMRANDYDRARSLASTGIDANKLNVLFSPFAYACMSNSSAMCAMLIEFGADVNEPQSISGEYPIHLTALSGDLQKVWLIRNHGADVFAKDGDGKTAMFNAATGGAPDVISVLASWGLDVNAKDKDGNTPVLSVVATMEHLRQRVQDYNSTQDDDSDRILDADEEIRERLDAIRTLVAWGADINAVNDAGDGALTLAENANEASLTDILVELGAVRPATAENNQTHP